MLGLSATYEYYLFNGTVDMRKGVFRLAELVRNELGEEVINSEKVFIFLSRNRRTIKILRYERGFFVLYEKRPLGGRFRRPIFDDTTKKYKISWSDMIVLTESVEVKEMTVDRQK